MKEGARTEDPAGDRPAAVTALDACVDGLVALVFRLHLPGDLRDRL